MATVRVTPLTPSVVQYLSAAGIGHVGRTPRSFYFTVRRIIAKAEIHQVPSANYDIDELYVALCR